jgi:hypothetical protein
MTAAANVADNAQVQSLDVRTAGGAERPKACRREPIRSVIFYLLPATTDAAAKISSVLRQSMRHLAGRSNLRDGSSSQRPPGHARIFPDDATATPHSRPHGRWKAPTLSVFRSGPPLAGQVPTGGQCPIAMGEGKQPRRSDALALPARGRAEGPSDFGWNDPVDPV